jgi:NTP pyrophosphatase (non-canonical NTP hydrolase)
MNIKELSKKAHEAAVKKGFYDNPDRELSEIIALINSELYEALEAHRKGKLANTKEFTQCFHLSLSGAETEKEAQKKWNRVFEDLIKDSLEDEIADTFIRLFDMIGYLNIDTNLLSTDIGNYSTNNSVSHYIIGANCFLCEYYRCPDVYNIQQFINMLMLLCKKENIDIEKFIKLKMQYNETRPYKHGKKY